MKCNGFASGITIGTQFYKKHRASINLTIEDDRVQTPLLNNILKCD